MTGDEMQMKVLGPLAKGDGIDALASADLFHETAGIADSATPIGGFCIREVKGS